MVAAALRQPPAFLPLLRLACCRLPRQTPPGWAVAVSEARQASSLLEGQHLQGNLSPAALLACPRLLVFVRRTLHCIWGSASAARSPECGARQPGSYLCILGTRP